MRTHRRWLVAGVVAVPLLLAVAVLGLLWHGLNIDASAWRPELAARLSEALRRPVRLSGPLMLNLSLAPSLAADGLSVAAPDGDLLTLGSVRFGLDLPAWLSARSLRIREFSARDLNLTLREGADGRGNWAEHPPAPSTAAPAAAPGPGHPDGAKLPASLAIDRFELQRLRVSFTNAQGVSHQVEFDSLQGQAAAGEPVRASVRGRVDQRFAFELDVRAGALDALLGLIGSARPQPQAWPLAVGLRFLGSSLQADGELSRAQGPWQGRFDLGVGTPDMLELEQLLGRELPKAGAAAMAAELRLDGRKLGLRRLVASIGQSAMTGDLELALDGARPRLSGALVLPVLDLRPFLEQDSSPDPAGARGLAQWYREIAQARLPLARLRGFDLDLDLAVARWLHLPGEVRDATLKLGLRDGQLHAPMRAVIAGVGLDGDLLADVRAEPPTVELTLGARDSLLGDLAELAFGWRGINGALGGFALRLAAQGDRVGDLTRSLDVRMVVSRAGLSYGNADSSQGAAARPIGFGLESMVLTVPPGMPMSLQAEGSLLDQPLNASAQGASLASMMQGRSPLRVSASSRSLQATVEGSIGDPASGQPTDLRIALSASRAGDAARWLRLGEGAGAGLALAMQGRARWQGGRWSLESGELRIGRNRFKGEISHAAGAGAGKRALVSLDLSAEELDLAELQSLMPAGAQPGDAGTSPVLDLPILPARIDLSDTDLRVRVGRITGGPLPVTDVRFDAQMRDGRLLASPFAARIPGIGFEGAVAFDQDQGQPRIELWLGADDADVGRLLREFKLAERIDARAQRLVLHALARGRLLSQVLEQTTLLAEWQAGSVALRDRNTGAAARIAIDRGMVTAQAGEPVRVSLKGRIDGEPIELDLRSGRLVELAGAERRVPIDLDASAAGARLRLKGSMGRPLRDAEVEMAMELTGERLEALSPLARVSLPPWGPYSMTGRLILSGRGYEVPDLRLKVGRSDLRGSGSLDTRRQPAQVDLNLSAPSIQLDDFRLGQWWPFEARPASTGPASLEALRTRAREAGDQAQRLLSREVLSRQNATLLVRVDEVLSGADRLGNGWLVAKIDEGRADVGPVQIDVPGGRASFWLEYAPGPSEVALRTVIQVQDFDYGILARRLRPQAELGGRLSLDVDIRSRAPSLAQLLAHGDGTIDFSLRPAGLKADVFDLWAANLFVALASRLDPSNASTINCGVGRFTLSGGVLSDRLILLDTTRVRVRGHGRVDFRDETLALRLEPTPKRAQFFSLATPIEVTGGLADYKIGVSPGDALATAGRLAGSLLWVPLQSLIGKELPADGADVCPPAPALSR